MGAAWLAGVAINLVGGGVVRTSAAAVAAVVGSRRMLFVCTHTHPPQVGSIMINLGTVSQAVLHLCLCCGAQAHHHHSERARHAAGTQNVMKMGHNKLAHLAAAPSGSSSAATSRPAIQ
jgi:hypothetical protein